MKIFHVAPLIIVLLVCTPGAVGADDATPTPSPSLKLPLRAFAEARGIHVGAAVAIGPLRTDKDYQETLAREFNMLTAENAMKWEPLRPAKDQYNFADADYLVDFAQANHMQVRGHTLVWHNQLPHWLTDGNFSREELMNLLHDHIKTVVGHYKGRIVAWDVVNEAIADGAGGMRDTIWQRTVGPEYIELAFRWAHEADPDALLFYNDYNGEDMGRKSNQIYNLVKDLVARGVPINGVGLQMHIGVDYPPDPKDVAANIERLAALGLQVHITEMDVKIQNGGGSVEERLVKQAEVYRGIAAACVKSSACTAFVTWGFTDLYTWIPGFTGKADLPLLFDQAYRPKPAYQALADVLAGR